MEILIYEKSWLNIPLPNVCHQPARNLPDASFYDKFYKTFWETGADFDRGWYEYKIAISDWIHQNILLPRQNLNQKQSTILSLGAGTGLIEREWLEKKYDVHLQECQSASLDLFKKNFPNIKTYIGDARSIDCENNAYDIIVFIALDYVFDRFGYKKLLTETNRILSPGGIAICYCMSNISPKMILSFLWRTIFKKKQQGILWGYARSLAEHVKIGRQVGLVPQSIYLLQRQINSETGGLIQVSRREPRFWGTRLANASDVVVEFIKPLHNSRKV